MKKLNVQDDSERMENACQSKDDRSCSEEENCSDQEEEELSSRDIVRLVQNVFHRIVTMKRPEFLATSERFQQDVFFEHHCIHFEDTAAMLCSEGYPFLLESLVRAVQLLFPLFTNAHPLLMPWMNVKEKLYTLVTPELLMDAADTGDGNLNNGGLLRGYHATMKSDWIASGKWAEEYCWSPVISGSFLRDLLRAGYIPLAHCLAGEYYQRPYKAKSASDSQDAKEHSQSKQSDQYDPSDAYRRGPRLIILMPKFGHYRCWLDPVETHVGKRVLKCSGRFSFAVDEYFDDIVRGCRRQHGESWLFPPVSDALKILFEDIRENDVTVHAIAVLQDERFVAGELGVLNGRCYTSLTGCSLQDNAGSVQLAALGRWLAHCGVCIWDLGMPLPYKGRVGARNSPRKDFFRLYSAVSSMNKRSITLPKATRWRTCQEILRLPPAIDRPAIPAVYSEPLGELSVLVTKSNT